MIKELRESTGMTQKQFAYYFGIPHRTIQNWENGARQCPDYLYKLMKYKIDKEFAELTEYQNSKFEEVRKQLNDKLDKVKEQIIQQKDEKDIL